MGELGDRRSSRRVGPVEPLERLRRCRGGARAARGAGELRRRASRGRARGRSGSAPAPVALDDELRRDRLARARRPASARLAVRDLGEHVEVELAADGGRRPCSASFASVREPVEPPADDLAHALRDRELAAAGRGPSSWPSLASSRTTSVTKNGLPSVCSWTAADEPGRRLEPGRHLDEARDRPRCRARAARRGWRARSRASSASVRASGWWRPSSTSR